METVRLNFFHLWKRYELNQGLQIGLGNLQVVTDREIVVG